MSALTEVIAQTSPVEYVLAVVGFVLVVLGTVIFVRNRRVDAIAVGIVIGLVGALLTFAGLT